MKRILYIAFTLTVLSLLLVAAATILFMGQSRSLLQKDINNLTEQTSQLEGDVADRGQTINQQADLLVTREAQINGLTGDLEASQKEAADSETRVADLSTSLAETESVKATAEAQAADQAEALAAVQNQPPLLQFASPLASDLLEIGKPVEIVVTASDRQGLAAVNVTANGESVASESPRDATLYTLTTTWQPENAGIYTLTAAAINTRGIPSDVISRTITIIDPIVQAAEIAGIRAEIEENVVEIRGLVPITPVVPTLLTSEELRETVATEFFADTTPQDFRDDAIVLSAFDFIEPDYDLEAFYTGFLSDQVAGFYDPEDKEFVVVSDDNVLSPNEKLTHAHEFVHALQDQNYSLEELDTTVANGDASLALHALAEGDATFTQFQYFIEGYLTPAEMDEFRQEIADIQAEGLPEGPQFLIDNFSFPYGPGTEFVTFLYEQGGYTAVDEAWADLPQSTEHILHPERYLAGDVPQLVSLPPLTTTLGTSWRLLDEDVFGEYALGQYLDQQLSSKTANQAAEGWGGDRYAVYWHEDDKAVVMVMALVWDSEAEADEFVAAYGEYAGSLLNTTSTENQDGNCWLAADVICLYQTEDSTLIVRAPDIATVDLVQAVIR